MTPGPDGRGNSPASPRPPQSTRSRWIIGLVLVGLVLNFWISSQALQPSAPIRVPYSPTFLAQVKAGNVSQIASTGDAIQGTFKKAVKYPASDPSARSSTNFATQVPSFANNQQLSSLLESENVVIDAKSPNSGPSFLESLIFGFGPVILIVLLFVFIGRRAAAGGAGGLMSFGRSRARRVEASEQPVTFADVAGIDEAKEELTEIVDFLKNPDKYLRLGARIPRGVLLSGSPGTGKTLLARAVAGEAGVPFFQMSASEFVEMIVGVGASRVRDLFVQAKAAAPSIIFIDELDAIGRSRAGGGPNLSGGHDEREQTLNQILTEMDGFSAREGVIVIAATNRADVLDQALLRPGRFDRRVMVQPPDRRGRAAILKIHTRNVPLGPDVDLDELAAQTPGSVGADLRNLVNEAALYAARRGSSVVTMTDFTESIEKTLLGPERNILLTPLDRERIAYHESGHALLGLLVPGADPVRKVTIIPRGMALGVTVQSPIDDRFNYGEDYLRARIVGALGGRAAESLVYGVVTTGAENDLQQVTRIAHEMVVRWGMSPLVGPLNYANDDNNAFQRPYSEATAKLIDDEVKRIADECFVDARRLLEEHRNKLDDLAKALLEHDSLDEKEILAVTGLTPPAKPPLVIQSS